MQPSACHDSVDSVHGLMKESILQCMIIGEDVEPIFFRFDVREPSEWLKLASVGYPIPTLTTYVHIASIGLSVAAPFAYADT